MNISQLERLRTMTRSIRSEINTDSGGCSIIANALDVLEEEIRDRLKSLVWARYLEAED